jgi:hypothetical protein
VICFSWFLWHDISLFIPTCCLSYSSSHKFFYTLYTGYKVRECYSRVRSLFQLQSHSGEHYLESNCFAPVIAFSSGLRFSWWLIVENFNQFMQYFNQLYFVFLNTMEWSHLRWQTYLFVSVFDKKWDIWFLELVWWPNLVSNQCLDWNMFSFIYYEFSESGFW